MKSFLLLLALVTTHTIAKDAKDFNQTLLNDVQKDILKNNDNYKKREPVRGPASVDEKEIQAESKLDKNIRQIGPRTW